MSGNMADIELCYMPAIDQMRLFRARKLSPVEVLAAQLRRIKILNAGLVAVTEIHADEAMAMAQESERRYMRGEGVRALEGVTVAVKDEVDIAGWRVTAGSLGNRNAEPAAKDCCFGGYLRAAGAVLHVQTNVPEYYCNVVTWNHLWGTTRNPWNPAISPGGSSGGSAAALAAGFATLATGSDMGGSIRVPAAMCGLYGFKPPYGRVATSLMQMESEGPMARNFADMVLMQNACSGPVDSMPSTIRPKLEYPQDYEGLAGLKIAFDPMEKWGLPMDGETGRALLDTVARLEKLGATVEEVDLGLRADDFETYVEAVFSTYMGPYCFEAARKYPEETTPYLKALAEKCRGRTCPKAMDRADTWVQDHSLAIKERVFRRGFSAILMPTIATPQVPADLGNTPENDFITINGGQYPGGDWRYCFTWPWNMMGWYPVVSVPVGRSGIGVPLGAQIIADTYDDLAAFRVAAALSAGDPGFFRGGFFPG